MYQIETLTVLRPTQVLPAIVIIDDSTIIYDFVTMGKSMGLEVDADDIKELLEEHSIKLTTEELEHLPNEQGRNWLIKLKKKKGMKKMSQVL